MSRLRLRDRRAFYRSRWLRELAAVVRWRARDAPDLAHLAFYDEVTWGPIMRDEALLLHGLTRALRPRTVVEIGFLAGDSAFNFLCALDEDARLYSFDVDPAAAETARERLGHDPRLIFRHRSQEQIGPDDLDGRLADLVFLDGAHALELNQATIERLLMLMAPSAVLAIHDTGTIPRRFVPEGHWTLALSERWVDDEYEHQPDERALVNWLLETHPELSQIHVHSRHAFRHGLTLLQRSTPLRRPEGDSAVPGGDQARSA
jgi:predicted O-methyltransferase YrrM